MFDSLFWLPQGEAPGPQVRFGTSAWPFVGDRIAQRAVLDGIAWFRHAGREMGGLYILGPPGSGKTLLARAAFENTDTASGMSWIVSGGEFRRIVRQLHSGRDAGQTWQRLLARPRVVLDGIESMLQSHTARHTLEEWIDRSAAAGQQLVATASSRPNQVDGTTPRLASRLAEYLEIELPAIPPPSVRRWLIARFLTTRHAPQDETAIERLDRIWEAGRYAVPHFRGLIDRLLQPAPPGNPAELEQRIAQWLECSDQKPTLHEIARTVSRRFGVALRELRSSSRRRSIARARKMAMYLCLELTEASYRQIGEYFGRRDHSTAVHAHRAVRTELDDNIHLQRTLAEMQQELVRLSPPGLGQAACGKHVKSALNPVRECRV